MNDTSFSRVIPDADLFYVWVDSKTNREMIDFVHQAMLARRRRALVFAGYDWHLKQDRKSFVHTVLELNNTFGSVQLHRIFFDERPDDSDVLPTYNVSYGPQIGAGPNPSYTQPFADRPGQWGVFHILGIPVGHQHR